MTNFSGGMSVGTTGSAVEYTGFGFRPTQLKFTAGAKSNSSANIQVYTGTVDETGYQGAFSTYGDSGNEESKAFPSNTRCIYIREWNGASWVTRVDAAFDSFTNDGFKLDVSTADINFDVWVDATDV